MIYNLNNTNNTLQYTQPTSLDYSGLLNGVQQGIQAYSKRKSQNPFDTKPLFKTKQSLINDGDYWNASKYAKGGWIQHAINPAHKGYCTPMTKSTCTPHRKALAMRFKHGDLHKHAEGGMIDDNQFLEEYCYGGKMNTGGFIMNNQPNMYPEGGVVKGKNTKAYYTEKGDTATGYSEGFVKGVPTSRYFYSTPDSILDYERTPNGYDAVAYRSGKNPIPYSNTNNPLTLEQLNRLTKSVRTLTGDTTKKFAHGGVNTVNPNAEVEQGEVMMTPQGDMHKVSDQAPTHAEGGVKVNMPDGTGVLGKLVEPYTNKQYKELGDKLYKEHQKYTKILENKPTGIAKKSAEMMLDKINNKYNNLLMRQEQQKQQEGLSDASGYTEEGMPEYGVGTFFKKAVKNFTPIGWTASAAAAITGKSDKLKNWTEGRGFISDTTYGSHSVSDTIAKMRAAGASEADINTYYANYQATGKTDPQDAAKTASYNKYKSGSLSDMSDSEIDTLLNNTTDPAEYQRILSQAAQKTNSKFSTETYDKFDADGSIAASAKVDPFSFDSTKGYQWNNITAQQLTNPAALKASDYYNPYEQETLSTLKNMKANVDPQLQANRDATAVAYSNLRNLGGSGSRMRSGMQAAQLNRMKADQQVMASADNQNNQYLTNYANTLGQMGQQRAATKLGVEQYNTTNAMNTAQYNTSAVNQVNQYNASNAMNAYNQNYQNQLNAYQTNVQSNQSAFNNALAKYQANQNTQTLNAQQKFLPYQMAMQANTTGWNQYQQKQAQDQANKQMWMNLLGQGVGAGASLALASDINVKQNLVKLTNISGINIYSFEYKDVYELPKGLHLGIIAQEIEDIIPEAITIDDTYGYKKVDYSKVLEYINKQ